MFNLTRRVFGIGLLAATVAVSSGATAQELKQLSIGYQKTGLPVIARQQQVIEKALEDKGVTVKWVEF
ncbi:sulfonate ABC transporter substrate-binding protein, partial [Mesorhizobium sp. M7A.F.Ca.CA.004.09.1.2]